jgi:hypothetical protein
MATEQKELFDFDDMLWIRFGLHSAIAALYREDSEPKSCMIKVYEKVDIIIHQKELEKKFNQEKETNE